MATIMEDQEDVVPDMQAQGLDADVDGVTYHEIDLVGPPTSQ